jgi:hypothetical protein
MKLKIFLVALLLMFVFSVASTALAMTESERQALITQIKAQIAQLTQQLQQMLAEQQGTTTWCYTFNNNLGTLNSGGEVVNLHIALQKEGISYSPDDINTYGAGTINAVSAFQQKYASEILYSVGLNKPTGFFGNSTRIKMDSLYGCSSTNPNPNPNPTTCFPNWQCSDWATCSGNQQTRNCYDSNYCGVSTGQPSQTQSCTSTCTPNWQCSDWTTCSGNQQTRNCYDSNYCGVTSGAPAQTQSCTVGTNPNPNQCNAACITQSDGAYSVDCYGNVTKCNSGETCQQTHDTNYTYVNGAIQTVTTLTGSQCIFNANPNPNPNPNPNTCNASCVTQSDGIYSIDCNGTPTKCPSGQVCQQTHDTNLVYVNGAVQTVTTLTGSECTCVTNWQCTDWSGCSGGQQTKTCTDSNNCGTSENEPSLTQACTCTPNYQCGAWGACTSSGTQQRTCTDSNSCNCKLYNRCNLIPDNSRTESQACTYVCQPNWSCVYNTFCTDGYFTGYCTDYVNHCESPATKTADPIKCTPENCQSNWQCDSWSSCYNSQQTRNCYDAKGCNTSPSLATTQSCVCTPNWSCGLWNNTCVNGKQTRSCYDSNNCGTTANDPQTSRNCPPLPAPIITCTDSDGGINPAVAGTVTVASDTVGGINHMYFDVCSSIMNPAGIHTTLNEYYCLNNAMAMKSISCPGGCIGNRCN